MKKAIMYMHGKGGNAGEAEHYKDLCPGYEVYGMDYKGTTPWDSKDEIAAAYDGLMAKYDSVTVIANSIGAYFTMHALQGKPIEKALFISPIVNMEKLIRDMMLWANVSEAQLVKKGEIETSFGETLSWEYLQYVRNNRIVWAVPTEVLYAGKDHLTSRATMEAFCEATHSALTVMEDGEHWFHTDMQLEFLDNWIKSVL